MGYCFVTFEAFSSITPFGVKMLYALQVSFQVQVLKMRHCFALFQLVFKQTP
jgi:hypothetical protein